MTLQGVLGWPEKVIGSLDDLPVRCDASFLSAFVLDPILGFLVRPLKPRDSSIAAGVNLSVRTVARVLELSAAAVEWDSVAECFAPSAVVKWRASSRWSSERCQKKSKRPFP